MLSSAFSLTSSFIYIYPNSWFQIPCNCFTSLNLLSSKFLSSYIENLHSATLDMPSETTKADPLVGDREKQTLELEIREMISALTKRLSSLQHVHKAAGASNNNEEDEGDDHGTRIITLAGNNVGAAMRGELDGKQCIGDKKAHHTKSFHYSWGYTRLFQAIPLPLHVLT